MTRKQRAMAFDLLRRAGVSDATVSECTRDENCLCIALEVCADIHGDKAPDKSWNKDHFSITGDHMVLTEEGWMPADANTREATGAEPMAVLDEVNAPRRSRKKAKV